MVRIIECRPMSKLKRWTLGEVMRKAVQVTTDLSSIGIAAAGREAGFKEAGQEVKRWAQRRQETRIYDRDADHSRSRR